MINIAVYLPREVLKAVIQLQGRPRDQVTTMPHLVR